MDTMRCFVAVETPQPVRAALADIQAAAGRELARVDPSNSAARSLKWVDPSGIHLTLKFLGPVPSGQIPAIEAALREGCTALPALSLRLSGLGAFPSPQRARVLWVGLGGDLQRLAGLQQCVEATMADLGYEPEARAFSPHLTLARVREEAMPEDRRRLGEAIARVPPPPPISFPVDALSLMRSELGRAGARYTRLALLPLASGPKK